MQTRTEAIPNPVAVRRNIPLFQPYVAPAAVELVSSTLRSGYIGEGPRVQEFEDKIKNLFGMPYPVAVNSGTAALELALDLLNVGPGDEVITTPVTFIATSQTVLARGATVVFADVDWETGNISAADIERRITSRTKAILPVHWGGYPCDMEAIGRVAAARAIPVIEDAAQAFGARYQGRYIGSLSPITCFSFQAVKQITTGDGGLVAVQDEKLYETARRRRWFGIDRKGRKSLPNGEHFWPVSEIGYKYHMNDIAASIGLANLAEWPALAARRQTIADHYRAGLAEIEGLSLWKVEPGYESAHWTFFMHVLERRDEFVVALQSRGVMASIIHSRIDDLPLFAPYRTELPNVARLNETMVALPLHTGLSDEDVTYVINSIRAGW